MDNCFAYSQRNLAHIGYHLVKTMPDVADKIISESPLPYKEESDTSLIRDYFAKYCLLLNLSQEEMLLVKNSYAIAEKKRQFVGLILKLYYPHAFKSRSPHFTAGRGFVKNLAEAIGLQRSNTSKMLNQVRAWTWQYSDFADGINHLYDKLKEYEAIG